MRVQFWGAVRTVTGSMHLLETGDRRILLDCGMFQGKRAEANERNRSFPFDAASIDAVVLSHAHLDHCGAIPSLVKRGFRGKVWGTDATVDLCEYILRDSGHVQQTDAEHLNRLRRPGEPEVQPIYGEEDAIASLRQFAGIHYGGTVTPVPSVRVTFFDAGHILGSSCVLVEASENGRTARLAFTGDLGRRHFPLLNDPQRLPAADAILSESTYGDRHHGPTEHVKETLLGHMQRVFRRGGKCVVPAFALGRTQGIVYMLNGLYNEGKLPAVPIFVDTPLGLNVTEVFRKHAEMFNEEARHTLMHDPDVFGFPRLSYIRTPDESKRLNDMNGPFMVISASGMCEGGRILHHLEHSITDARNMVLLTGYQAEHTLGRRLQEGAKVAKIYGKEFPVHAEVVKIDGLSCHADQGELTEYVSSVSKQARVFLVHGELPACEALRGSLRSAGVGNVTIPERGQTFEV